jgi:FkbM family methyltransferase
LLFKIGICSTIKLKKYGEIHLRKNTLGLPVFRQVFLDCEYSFLNNFNDSKIIIDAGANIGMFTRFVNPIFPNSKYIYNEPKPINYEGLKRNTTNINNVFPLRKALCIDDNSVIVNIDPKYGEWGATTSKSTEKGARVDAIAMNQLLIEFELEQVDILKIDIENAEKFLFQGELNWMKKTRTIIIELHDFMDNAFSNNFFKALDTIEPYNFSVVGKNIIRNNIV